VFQQNNGLDGCRTCLITVWDIASGIRPPYFPMVGGLCKFYANANTRSKPKSILINEQLYFTCD
jgi:hypothetical protein